MNVLAMVKCASSTFIQCAVSPKQQYPNLGYADFSEWMLGHSGSTYYDSPVSDLIAVWRKVEPYLTFLDVTAMEVKQQYMQTQLDDTKEQLQKAKEEFQHAPPMMPTVPMRIRKTLQEQITQMRKEIAELRKRK